MIRQELKKFPQAKGIFLIIASMFLSTWNTLAVLWQSYTTFFMQNLFGVKKSKGIWEPGVSYHRDLRILWELRWTWWYQNRIYSQSVWLIDWLTNLSIDWLLNVFTESQGNLKHDSAVNQLTWLDSCLPYWLMDELVFSLIIGWSINCLMITDFILRFSSNIVVEEFWLFPQLALESCIRKK